MNFNSRTYKSWVGDVIPLVTRQRRAVAVEQAAHRGGGRRAVPQGGRHARRQEPAQLGRRHRWASTTIHRDF